MMMHVVLTGGIGSGKSLVADYFQLLGVSIIDADVIARELLTKDTELIQDVLNQFDGILEKPGVIDRRRLRTKIFQDNTAKQWLEQQLHPRIWDRIKQDVAACASNNYMVVIPLLVETGLQRLFDTVMVVDVPEIIQRQRVQLRDNLSSIEVNAILSHQVSRAERNHYANILIDNSYSFINTQEQVRRINEQVFQKH
jgi:dephospho-CoA kinase